MLLVDGFTRPDGPHAKIASLTNMKTGAVVPADMTKTVCKHKPVTIASSKDLSGWGISFGNYESSETADMALRGRLLSQTGKLLPGTPGLIRLPGKGGYAAAMWNLDQQKSLSTCAEYRKDNAPCEVLTPQTFAQIAALTPEPAAKPAAATAQGSDGVKVKRKKSSRRQKN